MYVNQNINTNRDLTIIYLFNKNFNPGSIEPDSKNPCPIGAEFVMGKTDKKRKIIEYILPNTSRKFLAMVLKT